MVAGRGERLAPACRFFAKPKNQFANLNLAAASTEIPQNSRI